MSARAYNAALTLADRLTDGREHIASAADDDRTPGPIRDRLHAALDLIDGAHQALMNISEGGRGDE